MQQNILSQMPAPGSKQDAPGSRQTSNSRDPDGGPSRFDQVSRAEQKRLEQGRLEQKQASRREQADRTQDKREQRRADQARDDSKRADKPEEKPKSEAAKPTDESGKASEKKSSELKEGQEQSAAGDSEALHDDLENAMAPVTFALLQTMSGAGAKAATDAPVPVNSEMAGKAALQGLLSGQTGQNAGKMLATPGAQLTDLLSANVSAETSRPVDPTSLLGSPRFQTTLEQAAQQSLQPGKLTAENAVPLRSYATSVDVPVGQAEWGDKVMGKLSFLTARNMQVAEIHLTPPDMGPMEVKVRMQNEQANITVHAANPVVREQLEQNSHRLRDMLSEQGVELGRFDVSSQSDQQAGEQGDETGEGGTGQGEDGLANGASDDEVVQTGHLDLAWKGEVDLFA